MSNPQEEPKVPVKVQVTMVDFIPLAMWPAPLVESDIMLDPWVELPPPSGGFTVITIPGELPPPDLPEIPQDWEDS